MQPLLAQDVTLNNSVTPLNPQWQNGPGGRTLTFGYGIEKILAPNLDAEIDSGFAFQSAKGEARTAYPNDVTVLTRYVFWKIPEFQMAVLPLVSLSTSNHESSHNAWGSSISWGGRVAALTARSDLAWLRPLEVHGDLGYKSDFGGFQNPELYFDPVIDYSLPYYAYTTDKAISSPLRNLCVFTEFNFDKVLSGSQQGPATMYLTPGLSYLSETTQVSAGVQLPVNHGGSQTENLAVIGKVTFFVDAIYPAFGWMPF